jgi:hypothetical protein
MQTKVCERCGHAYAATHEHFGSNWRHRDGLALYCRNCAPAVIAERRQRKNERSKAWAAANREKARETARKSYAKTRHERLEYMRRWRQANKEKIKAYAREYRQQQRK